MSPTLTLRPILAADEPFLRRVYASTREEELAPVPWSAAEKEAFLAMQFAAQHSHYQQNYVGAQFAVLMADGEPIGRLYVARWEKEIRVIDIAILPAYRRQGIGGRLLQDLLREADEAGKPVTIHVERFNPAQRLYSRLGFRPIGDVGVYQLWERVPASHPSATGDRATSPQSSDIPQAIPASP